MERLERLESRSSSSSDPLKIIENAKLPISVSEYLPRLKEGGAFVKYSLSENASTQEVARALTDYLEQKRPKPWWNPFERIRASVVHGKPWIEDLYRQPTARLKVEFLPPSPGAEAVELSQEQLYSFFRSFGKLRDIVSQPPDSKILPKYALLEFSNTRRATMAKNCLHGYLVSPEKGGGKVGTVLRLSYEEKAKQHWIRDWIFNHPRLVIPILAALVAGITVAVFDPIRTFFIRIHVLRTLHFADNKIYRWFKAQATDILSFRHKPAETGMEIIWDDRRPNITQIQTWLMETADTFIIVQGPRGAGKRELVVDQALKNRKFKLIVDCKPIQEARGDGPTIAATAAQVGYRPVFSWMNSMSGWIDLAAQGAAGMKTGFSETLETQLRKILNNTATALSQIALQDKDGNDKDKNMTDDEYLEAYPERRPVVVIDNFLHKSQEKPEVYDKIAEWAANLTTANVAHVIFLTNDVAYSKSLSKALPGRVFRQISLSDCSPSAAKRFVISHIDSESTAQPGDTEHQEKKISPSQKRRDLQELDECIDALGGRLTDLEFLARRIKSGETPKKAVREIVEQSASEILKVYLFGHDVTVSGERKWSTEQAWLLIKKLAAAGEPMDGQKLGQQEASLRYNEILLDDTFKADGDAVLQALEQAELISIVVAPNGRPASIKPGKPVYLPAFRRLVSDDVLRARLDLAILTQLIKAENGNIEKYEAELKTLGGLPRQPGEVAGRVRWLLGKVMTSQSKVEAWEYESGILKKVLQKKF
ncbi:hypothetical protein EJ06DRAFT_515476 [Trichodelitschia bisporula]|uniref:Mitochondrial escape protein 2 n=1 Tax=Trichodelitschia bisporula TaxID=703511 RepID=A0A6G1HMC6_9PEZI|nr:hypothetical protein EJ06DRAFT_515476 [Trichodelitschia bisporula]